MMNNLMKANLLWFVTFAVGMFLTWLSYGHDPSNFILFVFGIFIVTVGSIFAGHIASK
jgi:hypothetical protein